MLELSLDDKKSNINETVKRWSNVNAVLIVLAVLATTSVGNMQAYALLGALSFSYLLISHRQYLKRFTPFAGVANWITLIRLSMLVYLFSIFAVVSVPLFFSLMVVAVLLDAVDGRFARRYNHVSPFGQYFDMEVDAYFVMGMGVYFFITTPYGYWLLIPGLMRYGYRLLVWLGPKPDFEENRKRYAATLAGINFVLLLVSIVLPEPWQLSTLVISTVVVSASFSISIFEYFRHAKRA